MMMDALKKGGYGFVISEALAQINEGAEILDVNCGYAGIDEAQVLEAIVKVLQNAVKTPIMLDSADYKALERAAEAYKGKPIINSVNGKKESLDNILPVVKKYSAAVVGMCLDEDGIPQTVEGRIKITGRIIAEAEKYRIPKEDIIIDCVCEAAVLRQENIDKFLNGDGITDEKIIRNDIKSGGAKLTLEAIKAVKKKFGVRTILGISNISYGLPDRGGLNKIFLERAAEAGLDMAIMNPRDRY